MNHCIFKGVLNTNLHEILHMKHCKINTLTLPKSVAAPTPTVHPKQNAKPHTTHTHTALYSTYNSSVAKANLNVNKRRLAEVNGDAFRKNERREEINDLVRLF